MKISKSMRKQLLERAMHKTGIPADSSCWVVTDLVPADCKLQDFWPLIEEWLEENCSNEPVSQYTEFGRALYTDACTLYRALLGEYAEIQGLLDHIYAEVWDDLYEAQNQDARCILVKYFLIKKEEADLLSPFRDNTFFDYIPHTNYGKYVEKLIRG